MLLAAILLMGSLIGNPALPNPGSPAVVPAEMRGVYAVTRHPMKWAFALWGLRHIAIYPVRANIILAAAIIILALVGAALQDRKKEALQPDTWPAWESRTSYWPFAAILSCRARLGGFGMHALAGGFVLWLAATRGTHSACRLAGRHLALAPIAPRSIFRMAAPRTSQMAASGHLATTAASPRTADRAVCRRRGGRCNRRRRRAARGSGHGSERHLGRIA